MHIEDVLFADTEVNEAVLEVWTHIWPLPLVPYAVFLHMAQSSEFQLAQIKHDSFSMIA